MLEQLPITTAVGLESSFKSSSKKMEPILGEDICVVTRVCVCVCVCVLCVYVSVLCVCVFVWACVCTLCVCVCAHVCMYIHVRLCSCFLWWTNFHDNIVSSKKKNANNP